MTGAIDVRLEEAQEEMKHLREAFVRTKERLAKAEEALRFYSNVTNYAVNTQAQEGIVFQNRVVDDFDRVDIRTHVGGRRAREYFKQFSE